MPSGSHDGAALDGARVGSDASDKHARDARENAETMPLAAEVPTNSSVMETRTASGDRRLGATAFDGGPEVGETVAGHYLVLSVLGEGGMGRVYACENQRTGKRVALKWVPAVQAGGEDAIARFAREARVAGHVEHPNVIDVYDVVEEGPATFLVMELLRGEALGDLLERTPKLPVKVAVDILLEAMRGIAAAHQAGVIHRDLKPDNLFLCEGKGVRVKVVDFGVSKHIDAGPELALTQTGAVVGTPYYMAPEQMRGMRDLDQRLDVYALGAILYETLAGVQPYRADTLGALAIKVATEDPAPISEQRDDLPEGLEAVVLKAMARDREQRFASVEEFAAALEPFGSLPFASDRPPSYSGSVRLAMSSPDGPPAVEAPEADEPTKGIRRPLLAGALGVLAVVTVGWLLFGPARGQPTPPTVSTQPTVSTEEPAEAPDVAPGDVTGDPASHAPVGAAGTATSRSGGTTAETTGETHAARTGAHTSSEARPTDAAVTDELDSRTAGAPASDARRHRRHPRLPRGGSTRAPEQVMVAAPPQMTAIVPTKTHMVEHRAGDLGLDDF